MKTLEQMIEQLAREVRCNELNGYMNSWDGVAVDTVADIFEVDSEELAEQVEARVEALNV